MERTGETTVNGIQAMVSQITAMKSRPKDIRAHIVDLSKTMSQRQIALEVGVSRSTVFNVLRASRVNK